MPLPVRHDQRTGFYVDGLTVRRPPHPVAAAAVAIAAASLCKEMDQHHHGCSLTHAH